MFARLTRHFIAVSLAAILLCIAAQSNAQLQIYPCVEDYFSVQPGSTIPATDLLTGVEVRFQPYGYSWSEIGNGINVDNINIAITVGTTSVPAGDIQHTDSPDVGKWGYQEIDSDYTISETAIDAIRVRYNYSTAPLGEDIVITISGVVAADPQDASGMIVKHSFCTGDADTDFLEWNFTIDTTEPRDARAISMVLDKSGSMGSSVAPDKPNSISKMLALQTSAGLFLTAIPDYAKEGDKLGAVFFSSDAEGLRLDGVPSSASFLFDAADKEKGSELGRKIGETVAGGSTSIGDGLLMALDEGFARDPTDREIILLLSDGMQNTDKMVDESNLDWNSPEVKIGDRILPENIEIHSVVLGIDGSSARDEVMEALAEKRGGEFHSVEETSVSEILADNELKDVFVTVMTDGIEGDKVEIVKVSDLKAQLSTTAPGAYVHPFTLSALDRRLSIIVVAAGSIKYLSLKLISPPPGNHEIEIPRRYTRLGSGYLVASLPMPLGYDGNRIEPGGEWKLSVDTRNPQYPVGDNHVIILADNKKIVTEYGFGRSDIGTGESIPLEVALTEGGVPITDATVVALVTLPSDGYGNVMAQEVAYTSGPSATAGDALSPAEKKLAELLKEPAIVAALSQHSGPTINLQDPDGDGVFKGELDNSLTGVEGNYNFEFHVSGSTPANGAFTRTKKLTTHVRTKPAPDMTVATAEVVNRRSDGSGVVAVTFIPKDALGNFLGPGYGRMITVSSSEGTTVGRIVDKVNGTYVQRLDLPDLSHDPIIRVEVRGAEVVNRNLSELLVGEYRLSCSLHGGYAAPHSPNSNVLNGFISIGCDLEYRLFGQFSVEGYVGHDRFEYKHSGDAYHLTHVSAHARYTYGSGRLRPAIHVGCGAYVDENDTYFGFNAGATLQYWLIQRLAVEANYNFRSVDGGNFEYSTVQLGVRIGIM